MTPPSRKPFPRWAKYVGCVLLLALTIYFADRLFLIPLSGSSKPEQSTGLIYQITIGGGRVNPQQEWYVGYWLATFHYTVKWIAAALLFFMLLYGLYFKVRDTVQ
jgi:hypothetical protein